MHEFLEELFFIGSRHRIGLLSVDSGFYSQAIFRQTLKGPKASILSTIKFQCIAI